MSASVAAAAGKAYRAARARRWRARLGDASLQKNAQVHRLHLYRLAQTPTLISSSRACRFSLREKAMVLNRYRHQLPASEALALAAAFK